MATHSFEHQLEEFTLQIMDFVDSDDKMTTIEEFKSEVIRYILKIQKGMGSTAIKSLAHKHNFAPEWSFFKQQYLDMSAYVNRKLWKAIVNYTQDCETEEDRTYASDVMYCLSHLNADDLELLKKKKVNKDCNVDEINLNTFVTGKTKQRNLQEYFASKVGGLRYLVQYDPAMDLSDFEQDLAVEFCRVYNYYEQSVGTKLEAEKENEVSLGERFQKYGETALNNKVLNLKEYWGCESRRRVSTTDNKLYRTRARLKKELAKNPDDTKIIAKLAKIEEQIGNSNSDYFSVVTPLVRGNDGEFRELDAREIGNPLVKAIDSTQDVEETMWVNELIEGLPPKLSRFVQALLTHDEEFEKWFGVWSKAKKKPMDSNNIDDRIRGAFEYAGVTKEELKRSDKLLKFIERKRKGTWDHFFKEKGKTANQIVVKHHGSGKIMRAYLEDDRADGTCIFSITDPKYKGEYDTAFNRDWSVLHRGEAM